MPRPISEQIQGTYFRSPVHRGHHWPSVFVIRYFGGKMDHFGLRGSMSAYYWATANAPCPCGEDSRTLRKVQENREEQQRRKFVSRTASGYRGGIDEELFCWLPLCCWGDPICKQGL